MALYDPTTDPEAEALFIDDVSKRYFYDTELIHNEYHMNGAFWVPALGTRKFDGHIYVSGSTGSGKSYIIRKMVLNDKLKRSVILFTDLQEDDPSLQGINYTKYPVKDANGNDKDPLTDSWLRKNERDKILIFDDIQFNEVVNKYKNTMLQTARHLNSTIICVNHKLQDYFATKVALTDTRYVIGFPSSNKGEIADFMKNRMKMNYHAIQDVIDVACEETRKHCYLIFHKYSPNCIASRETIFRI